MIDWRAVEWVLNGSKLKLKPDECRAVVRRVQHKLRPANATEYDTWGTISIIELAALMGCTPRSVLRMKEAMPEADAVPCPVCGSEMWVTVEGFVEPHADKLSLECPMSLHEYKEEEGWESRTANTVLWLSQRLKAGDVQGVWDYINNLTVNEGRQMMVAALAGVSNVGDPFEWLKETA